jgi:hypothetical protein
VHKHTAVEAAAEVEVDTGVAALVAAAFTVAPSLEDFTVDPAPSFKDSTMAAFTALAPAPSFEDFMATTTGTAITATRRMASGTTTLTIRTMIPTTTTAVATLFSDGCTPRMARVCNPARYAVDRPSRIDVDRDLKRQLTA